MKRTLALLLLVSLLATPALAQMQEGEQGAVTEGIASAKAATLKEAVAEVSREIVSEETNRVEVAVPQDTVSVGSGWRTVIGIAMIAGGAGIIAKGFDIYQDEPDRYDRTKNADPYLAWGVGSGIMTFGVLTLKGGLEGRGF